MMGQQSGQMSMVILDIAELIPRDHLFRKINRNRSIIPRYPDTEKPWFPALTPPRTTTSFLLTRGADHSSQSPCSALRAQGNRSIIPCTDRFL